MENGPDILGDNSNLCKSNKTVSGKGLLYEKCQDTGIVQAPTYINGAAVRVDNSGDLYSLQFTTNEEVKRGKKYEENTVLLDGNSSRWGGKDRLFKVGEKSNTISGHNRGKFYEFNCPKGSGIYRIDTVHQPSLRAGLMSGNIKGVKFFCKDIKTGKNVDIKEANGKPQLASILELIQMYQIKNIYIRELYVMKLKLIKKAVLFHFCRSYTWR